MVAPTEISPPLTAESLAGEPIVLAVPWSPLGGDHYDAGGGRQPVELLRHVLVGVGQFVAAERLVQDVDVITATAQFIPWMIVEVNACPASPKTFIAYSVEPGATPSILMLQPAGSGLAASVNSCDRS